VVPREELIAAYRGAQRDNPTAPRHTTISACSTWPSAGPARPSATSATRSRSTRCSCRRRSTSPTCSREAARDAEGGPILRALVERLPDEPNARLALGFWMVRNGQPDAAREELRRAAETGAALSPRFAYVYAVSLADGGDRDQAMAVLLANLEASPTTATR
jgi:predicted Zn-dependent protease